MNSPLWVTLLVAMAALAGCTDDGDTTPALTEEDCAALGLILGTHESMDHDGMEHEGMDNDTAMEHNQEPACVPAGPPATVTIDGLPAAGNAYSNIAFTWTLHTDSADEMHTMDTQIRWATAGVDDASLGKPDTFGDKLAQKEHQNFFDGQSYDAVFAPEEAGTYYLRAFALVNGENLWSPEYMIEVSPVAPTGTSHTITCSNGGIPQLSSCDDPLTITLGDGVSWTTSDPAGSWTITKAGGPDGQDISTTSGGDEVVFLIPGSYKFEAEGTLGSVEGTIEVQPPVA